MTTTEQDWVRELQQIMVRLRAPDGCPWDIEQTHESLTRYLIEEAYEFIDAIRNGDDDNMADELGDLLLQIVFHCQIASEDHRFDLQDAARLCCEKMIRRHPHVFGDADIEDTDAVVTQWKKIKEQERGHAKRTSILDGVPQSAPALLYAQKISKKAAKTGFDWPDTTGPREKILEELQEVDDAKTPAEIESEIGDLLFAAVNLARKHGVDAETALRQTNQRFEQRFRHIEESYAARNIDIAQSPQPLDDLDAAWNRAKEALNS